MFAFNPCQNNAQNPFHNYHKTQVQRPTSSFSQKKISNREKNNGKAPLSPEGIRDFVALNILRFFMGVHQNLGQG
jgi:hypothetical protein